MPRNQRHLLFVGIYNAVVALDARDGAEVWRTKLGGMTFVNVYWDGHELFASAKGEVFRLDARTGEVRWHNKLKGLGTGLVTLATTRAPSVPTGQQSANATLQQAAAAAGAAAAT